MAAPKLRFKEFDGDWSSVSLLEISTLITKGTTPKQFIEGNINFLKIEAITQNGFDLSKCQTISDEINNKELKRSVLMEGDILFAIAGATIGKNAIVQKELLPANTNQALAIIRLKENYSKIFISKVLNSPLMEKYIDINISTGAQPNLNLQQIGSFSFALPKLEEQTKIASFLSAVDEKISRLTQKHQLLNQYKQGMMQKLFSQQLRFKADDGSEFGAWKHCKLKDVLISYRLGGNYSNAEMVTSYPLIKMGNLGRGSINLDKIEYIPEDQIIDPEDLIKKNDLFFNTRNTLDLVGKVALWRGELPIAYYNSNLLRLDFENNIFMNYLFNEQKTLEKLKAIASGTTSVAAIYTKDLLKINLEIPCLEEQNKIASFLSSIDQKIEVVAQQIEQAKTWKKGLLQQMFV